MIVHEHLAHKPTPEDLAEINGLLQELSPGSTPMTEAYLLNEVLKKGRLLVVRDTRCMQNDWAKIVGIGWISNAIPKPTGPYARIEDIVVAGTHRGQGLGERIVRMLFDARTCLGVQRIELESNPSRVVANALYVKLGMTFRGTNLYRIDFPD